MKVKRFLSVIIMISTMVSILMMSFPAKAMETVAVQNDSDSYKSNSDYDPCANGHNYKLTGWIWNGYESAYATFVCENKISDENFGSAHSKTITAQITSSVSTGSNGIIYTATVVCDGKTYTDTKIKQYGENGSKIIGDVDNDGRITSADALLVLRNSVGLEFFSDEVKKLADVDKDGKITSADSLDILRYSVGLFGNNDIGKKLEEEAQEDKTILYPGGDKVYVQSLDHLSYDEENSAIFFNNLLNVFTYDNLSENEANILAESVGGEVVGDISGAVNLLQIKIPTSDYSNIQLCVEKLLANDTVMYASYDVPMFMEPSAETNPWTVDSKPGGAVNTNNNTVSPDGNNWWAEAINAYTAWEYEDCFKPVNVGILDSGCMFDHEDLQGADLRLLEGYETNSPDEHGTHVTGIICAQDNSIGIRGIADRATVYSADWTPVTDNNNDSNYISYLNTGEYANIISKMIEKNDNIVINCSFAMQPIYSFTKFLMEKRRQIDKTYSDPYYVDDIGSYQKYKKTFLNECKRTAANCLCMMVSAIEHGHDKFLVVQAAGNGYDKDDSEDFDYYLAKGLGISVGYGADLIAGGFFDAITEEIFDENVHGISDGTEVSLESIGLSKHILKDLSFDDIRSKIITVGAIKNSVDDNGNYYMTDFSNYGDNLDICAPGQSILSTVTDWEDKKNYSGVTLHYKHLPGTSMAAPMVTAAAADVWAVNPALTPKEVKDILINSAEVKALGVGDWKGHSVPMLNVGRAVQAALDTVPKFIMGTVTDEDGKKIDNAEVIISDYQNTFTVSNMTKYGKYNISISESNDTTYSIIVKKDGYKTEIRRYYNVTRGTVADIILKKENPYTWIIEPTIEADDIISYDNQDVTLKSGYISPYNECVLKIKNNKYEIIKYDGTSVSNKEYDHGSFGLRGDLNAYDNYDDSVGLQSISVNPGVGKLDVKINESNGWGFVGPAYYWDNGKHRVYQSACSPIYDTKLDPLDYNVVVQSADIDNNAKVSNISKKYGIVQDDNLIVPVEYDKAYMHSFNDIIALGRYGTWTYFDKNGNAIISGCEGFESNAYILDWWQGHFDWTSSGHYTLPYLPTEGFIPVKINGKCGYYDINGNKVISCGTFEEVRPVHNGLAWVKQNGKWGIIKLAEYEQIPESDSYDVTVETVELSNSDIKSEWTNVTNISLKYPVFKSSDKALQDFLDKSVTQKILSYMKTDSEYKMRILGDYEYDMSLDGYISIVGRVNNIAEMSNGYPTGQYTFFVDLKNKKVLSLKDLFSNSESEVYEEIALKTNKYGQQSKISSALFNNSLLNYDYEKAKFNLNEGYLTMIFDPYEVASGVMGTVRIEIPVTDIELNSVINGVNINSIKP